MEKNLIETTFVMIIKGDNNMSKMNKEAILKLSNEINKKEGNGMLYSLGSKSANLNIPRWSTNIADLDSIIGGGMPEGRIIEIYGAESAGKTSLAYHMCGLHELCLDVPIEGCVDCDTEYMSERGWKKISKYDGGKVLQYNEDGTAQRNTAHIDAVKKAIASYRSQEANAEVYTNFEGNIIEDTAVDTPQNTDRQDESTPGPEEQPSESSAILLYVGIGVAVVVIAVVIVVLLKKKSGKKEEKNHSSEETPE